MQEETKEVKHLWPEDRAAVANQGVPASRANWCARWAQRFARAMPGIPLRARTTAQVRAVLRDLAQQAHVESGPVEQAQEALRRLSQACLPLPWARPWPFHAQAMAAARGGAQGTIRSRRGQLRRGRCGTSGGAAPVADGDPCAAVCPPYGTGLCALDTARGDRSRAEIAAGAGA